MGKQTASMKERIKNYYGVDIIRDVVREWGEQYWLQLDPDEKESQPIVSLVILYPNKVQVTHNHFGFHEILIGISGTCYHWCGERKIVLTKGKIGHVDNDCTHRIINPEATPAHFISVIYPDVNKTLVESDYLDQMKFSSMAKKFNLDKVIVNFADLVHMKCFLLDQDGSLYGNQEDLPALCKRCRKKKLGNCLLFDYGQQKLAVEEGTFQCCFGVTVNQLPVTVNHATLGYLLCGFGRISDLPDEVVLQHMDKNSEADYDALPLISPNHLIAIAKNLSLLTNTFVDLITTNQKDEELNTYKRDLTRERETQVQLEELLNQTQLKFLESQINVHFLFNTLNTIAQQAYIEGATNVASLTYALSNLLRLSLGKEKAEITIQEELNYIRDYLYIQKVRFPDKFKATFDIQPEILPVQIPLMSILVLIENAILHGFQNINYLGILEIKGYVETDHIIIQVRDNGCGVSDDVVDMVHNLPKTDDIKIHFSGIGLKNIYLRLKLFFDGNFSLRLEKLPDTGTLATLKIPYTQS